MRLRYQHLLGLAVALGVATHAWAAPSVAEGEIRKVDKQAAKLTIRHGELKDLNMPPMTMVFQVQDKAMLEQVAVGDKVRFTAARRDGALTVTTLEAAK